MKPATLLTGLTAAIQASLTTASTPPSLHLTSTTIYIQPILAPSSDDPAPLATVQYATTEAEGEGADNNNNNDVEILSYEAPDLPSSASLVRIGAWDPKTQVWTSATTVASAENFARGYAPTLALTVAGTGAGEGEEVGEVVVVGVAVKGVAVDAGHTRDFGPKAVLLRPARGRQVDLGKPVLLGPEGRKVEAEPEKSLLQK